MTMKTSKITLEQIKQTGLETLLRELSPRIIAQELGPVNMVRFFQQYETGHGDYSTERHQWLDQMDAQSLLQKIYQLREEAKDRKTLPEPVSDDQIEAIIAGYEEQFGKEYRIQNQNRDISLDLVPVIQKLIAEHYLYKKSDYEHREHSMQKPSLPYGVRPTPQQVEQVLRGEMDVVPRYGFSYEVLNDGPAFEQAKADGYVIDAYVGDRNIYFVYRLWCHAEGRPFVAILKRKGSNVLELDMTTTYPDETVAERLYSVLSEAAMAKVVYLFQVKLRGYCSWSPVHAKRENIKSIEVAKEAAALLYQIACEDVLAHTQSHAG